MGVIFILILKNSVIQPSWGHGPHFGKALRPIFTLAMFGHIMSMWPKVCLQSVALAKAERMLLARAVL